MGNKVEDAEAKLHDQTNFLEFRELMIVFSIMSISLLVCFIDQNGIGVLLPSIAKDLNAQSVNIRLLFVARFHVADILASLSHGPGHPP